MLLLVGLGNPGAKYARHRHNVGFMAVDAIADFHGFGAPRERFSGITREGRIETANGPKKAMALKPMTFMNESGRSVGAALMFFKLTVSSLVVFHDELDLAPGKYRMKKGGGLAGHNGLRSIAPRTGPDFIRGRIGIGHPGTKERVLNWVLGDYSAAEQEPVASLCDAIARSAALLALGDLDGHQTKVTRLAPAAAWPDLPGISAGGGRRQAKPSDG